MELSTDIIILLKSPTIGEALTPIRVSAIPSAIMQLAPGSDVRAEVLGRMVNGRTLMRVAGEVLTMELPESVTPGDTLRMTFLGREPRPTFSLSLQQNSSTPVAISQTGRWLGQIVQGDAGTMSRPEQLNRLVRLSDGPPIDTTRLAASLREALTTSGLFYESHLADWVAGGRQLSSIMHEPQASLSPQPTGTPPSPLHASNEQPASAVPGTDPVAPSSQPAPESTSATRQPPTASTPMQVMPTATEAAEVTAQGSGWVLPENAPQSSAPPVPQPAGSQPAAVRPGVEASQSPTTTPDQQGATAAPPEAPIQPSQQAEVTLTRTTVPQQAGSAPTATPPAAQTTSQQQAPSGQPVSSRQNPTQPLQSIDPAAADRMGTPASPTSPSLREATPAQRAEPPEVADPRAASIIRNQLATLNSGTVAWNGEAWPGQPLQWQIEDREARHRDASEGRWHSELRVDLPNLGNVVASLKIRGKKLHLSFTADTDVTTGLMQQEAPHLEERFAAAGLHLENMVIRHGKKERS